MLKFKKDVIEIDGHLFLSDSRVSSALLAKRIRGYARTYANTCDELYVLLGTTKNALKINVVNLDNITDLPKEIKSASERRLLEDKVNFLLNENDELNTLFTEDELFKFTNKKVLKNSQRQFSKEEFSTLWEEIRFVRTPQAQIIRLKKLLRRELKEADSYAL